MLTLFAALPLGVVACIPRNPYDYPVRGAYLVVLLATVLAFSLELFRLLARSERVRRVLRLTAYGFSLILLFGLIAACLLRVYERNWQQEIDARPAGEMTLRC